MHAARLIEPHHKGLYVGCIIHPGPSSGGLIQRNAPQQIAGGGNGCMSADARCQRRREIIGPMMTTQQRDDARPINSDTNDGGLGTFVGQQIGQTPYHDPRCCQGDNGIAGVKTGT